MARKVSSQGKKRQARGSSAPRASAAAASLVIGLAAHAEEAVNPLVANERLQDAARLLSDLSHGRVELDTAALQSLLGSGLVEALHLPLDKILLLAAVDPAEAVRQLAAAFEEHGGVLLSRAVLTGDIPAEATSATGADGTQDAQGGHGNGGPSIGLIGGALGGLASAAALAAGGSGSQGAPPVVLPPVIPTPTPNRPPSTTDGRVAGVEDTRVVLTLQSFGNYTDPDGDQLVSVRIASLPSSGRLTLLTSSGQTDVTAGAVVSADDIRAGRLIYIPAADAFGPNAASFTFSASDGALQSPVASVYVDLAGVADAPVNVLPASLAGRQGQVVALDRFSVTHPDGPDTRITVILQAGGGQVLVDGSAATVEGAGSSRVAITGTVTEVNAALAKAAFLPDPDFFGTATVRMESGPASGDTTLRDVDEALIVVARVQAGIASDGYIAGAQVFLDLNGDGRLSPGEPTAVTDAQGRFAIVFDGIAPVIVTGGVNIDTGLPNTVTLIAPPGGSTVTPLSTLLHHLIEGGLSPADANAKLAQAFGLALGTDVARFDILAAAAAGDPVAFAAQKSAASIVAVMEAASALGISSVDVARALAQQAAAANGLFDLSRPSVLASVLTGAGASAADASVAAQALAERIDLIAAATSLDGVTGAQLQTANNATPVTIDDAADTVGRRPVVLHPLANDVDPNGDPLRIVAINGVQVRQNVPLQLTEGTVTLRNDQSLVFVATGPARTVTLSYTASDGRGGRSDGSITIAVSSPILAATSDSIAAIAGDAAGWVSRGYEAIGAAPGTGHLNITDLDAQRLVIAGLHFAEDSQINLVTHGTRLASSVADLARLKVDAVVAGAGILALDAGMPMAALASSRMPAFLASESVTVRVDARTSSAADAGSAAEALSLAGVRVIDLQDQQGAFVLDTASANRLIQAGVHFAADDNVHLAPEGTRLGSQLSSLRALGVDVIVPGAAGLVVAATGHEVAASGLHFAATGETRLEVQSDDPVLADLAVAAGGLGQAGIDVIDVGGAAVSHVVITEAAANAMVAAGLSFAADDHVTLVAEGTHLATSLRDLRALGVDSVQSVAPVHVAAGMALAALVDAGGGPTFSAAGAVIEVDTAEPSLAETLARGANDLAALNIKQIDLDGSVAATITLTPSQAADLIAAGLTFAEGDEVLLTTADAQPATTLVEADGSSFGGADEFPLPSAPGEAADAGTVDQTPTSEVVAGAALPDPDLGADAPADVPSGVPWNDPDAPLAPDEAALLLALLDNDAPPTTDLELATLSIEALAGVLPPDPYQVTDAPMVPLEAVLHPIGILDPFNEMAPR